MADKLLELLKRRETSGAFGEPHPPKYMDAMVLSRGTVADINFLLKPETKSNVFQTYNVAVNGTSINSKTNFSVPPVLFLALDYLENDFVDDYIF